MVFRFYNFRETAVVRNNSSAPTTCSSSTDLETFHWSSRHAHSRTHTHTHAHTPTHTHAQAQAHTHTLPLSFSPSLTSPSSIFHRTQKIDQFWKRCCRLVVDKVNSSDGSTQENQDQSKKVQSLSKHYLFFYVLISR